MLGCTQKGFLPGITPPESTGSGASLLAGGSTAYATLTLVKAMLSSVEAFALLRLSWVHLHDNRKITGHAKAAKAVTKWHTHHEYEDEKLLVVSFDLSPKKAEALARAQRMY